MGLKTILEKTGVAGTTGLNAQPIPAADGSDAKSLTLFQGLHPEEKYDVVFTRTTQDGNLVMEASMDGSNWRRVAFRRLDLDTVAAGPVVLGASASFLVQLANPGQNQRIVAIRLAFWLAAAGAAGDTILISGWAGR